MKKLHDPVKKNSESSSMKDDTINQMVMEKDKATLWLIDDDAALRLILVDTFTDAHLTVVSFTQAQAAWTRLNDILQQREPLSELPDVILTDIRMGYHLVSGCISNFPTFPLLL